MPYLLLCACGNKPSATGNPRQELPVIQLAYTDTVLTHNYVADIQSVSNIEIRARVAGFMDRIYIDEGCTVKKGQLLFQISPKEYVIALDKARAAVASAKAEASIAALELKRIKTMVDRKVISPTELELGQAKVTAANAAIASALANEDEASAKLSYTQVRAPFDGIIDRIPLKAGSLVSEGALLTSLSDNRDMYAYFSVSENEYLQHVKKGNGILTPANKAELVLADGSAYPYEGRIETQEGEFNDNTGSINFRAVFPNPRHMLKHGASGKVHLSRALHQAVLVPQKSAFEIQDKNYVFVVSADNKVQMRSFVPQARIADYYWVKSGLAAGDRIVYEGVQNIRDGAVIQPRLISGRADMTVHR